MKYWLIKSEPYKYSWDQLVKDKRTFWDGVRNYTARNNMRAMKAHQYLEFLKRIQSCGSFTVLCYLVIFFSMSLSFICLNFLNASV